MICPNCGAEVLGGSKCPRCGTQFYDSDSIVEAEPVDVTEVKSPVVRHKKKRNEYRYDDSASYYGSADNTNYYYQERPANRFYQKTWFIVLALIFFWPLGLFLMWRYSRWNLIAKVIVSAIFIFAIYQAITGNDFEEDQDLSSVQAGTEVSMETSASSEATTPTTETPTSQYEEAAKQLVASRQDYLDELKFWDLAVEAKSILDEGSDELTEDAKSDLQELADYATALDNIYEADYSFDKEKDPSKKDYNTLRDSSYCSGELYDVLTEYKKFNNQKWKRKDIEKHDYGTDESACTVTAFTSFRLIGEDAGFVESNIEPVINLSVKYDGDDYADGSKMVSAEQAVDDSVKVKLDDGSRCLINLDRPKEITVKYDGRERALSNVVTASSDIVHKKDYRTKAPVSSSYTVYITNTGDKYHASGCQYLRSSKIAISKDDAEARGYQPCSRCRP